MLQDPLQRGSSISWCSHFCPSQCEWCSWDRMRSLLSAKMICWIIDRVLFLTKRNVWWSLGHQRRLWGDMVVAFSPVFNGAADKLVHLSTRSTFRGLMCLNTYVLLFFFFLAEEFCIGTVMTAVQFMYCSLCNCCSWYLQVVLQLLSSNCWLLLYLHYH